MPPTIHPDGLPIPAALLGDRHDRLGIIMAVLDGAIANVALPTIARDLNAEPGLVDLDRQRLPAGDHGLAAAAGGAGRHPRLPPRLSGGPGRCSPWRRWPARCRLAAAADRRARAAGLRRRRHHERQHRADPLHLSARACWAAASASTPWWSRSSSAVGPTVAARHPGGGALAVAVRRSTCRSASSALVDRPAARCRTRRAPAQLRLSRRAAAARWRSAC